MAYLEKITIIGAGLMGHGMAQIFACYGHPVWLMESNPQVLDSAKSRIEANLKNLESHGISFKGDILEILARIQITGDLARACQESDYVFEAIFEDLKLKQQLFADLDRLSPPNAILCSNTSVISITEIAELAKNRERIIGTHFWNPPYLIPLVEVIRARDSAEWCTVNTYNLLKRVGKYPVHVHKDVPGFVGNRLQHALWREAFAIIDEGICDPSTVDDVIRNGFGLRLPILGPVETADMIGLDLTLAIHNYILKHINADPTPSKTLQAKVAAGELGFKSGKGFLNWTESEKSHTRERLVSYLMADYAKRQGELKGGNKI